MGVSVNHLARIFQMKGGTGVSLRSSEEACVGGEWKAGRSGGEVRDHEEGMASDAGQRLAAGCESLLFSSV